MALITDIANTSTDTAKKLTDTVNDMINDTIEDAVKGSVKKRIVKIILLLLDAPGLKSNEIAEKVGASEVSIRRDMQRVKPLISFEGATKSGGCFLTKEAKERLKI